VAASVAALAAQMDGAGAVWTEGAATAAVEADPPTRLAVEGLLVRLALVRDLAASADAGQSDASTQGRT